MKRLFFISTFTLSIFEMIGPAFAERDWEYWARYSFEAPMTKEISYLVKPEWRMKSDMSYRYLFKLEQAVNFKIGKYFELAPYYVWQETRSAGNVDRSDLVYLDGTVKIPLKTLFDLKIIDRLRYQYRFDKERIVWRNSTRFTKSFKIKNFELMPFIEDEIFYDPESDEIDENWASAGVVFVLNKNFNIGVSYLLDTKKKGSDWAYANVLVTSMSLKF